MMHNHLLLTVLGGEKKKRLTTEFRTTFYLEDFLDVELGERERDRVLSGGKVGKREDKEV